MNWSLKCDRHEIFLIQLCSHRGHSHRLSDFDHKFLSHNREDFLHENYSLVIHGNDVAQLDFRVPNLLNLLEFPDLLDIICVQMLQVPSFKFSLDDSVTCGLFLSIQIRLCFNPVEHPFAILENSTLRRDWFFFLRQVSLNIQSVDLRL